MTRTEAYLALNLLPGIGPVRVSRLMERFGSPEAALRAPAAEIARVNGFGAELTELLSKWQENIDLTRELRRIGEVGATVICRDDEDYPATLREAFDCPLVLYVWGKLTKADDKGIAIVGSRRATHYGIQSARKLAFQLANGGLTVLSGLALGIDTAAHEGALAAKGRTVAVIGSGFAKLYPPENQKLAERIADGHGAVVSEFPIDYNPDKQSFPLRNRIVAGWSQGVLVVEAPARSGSLITVNQASDYGRPIYAVPGPIDRPTSTGCNNLIKNGARLVTCADDILEDLNWLIPPDRAKVSAPSASQATLPLDAAPSHPALSPEEEKLLASLGNEELHFDEIVSTTGLSAAATSVGLMKLELKKLVAPLAGRRFTRLV